MKVYGLLLGLLCQSAVFGHVVEGVEIPESVVVHKGKMQLDLQGASVRSKNFFNVYIAAFYSDETLKTPDEAVTQNVPKRMHFYFVHGLSAKKLKDAWLDGIQVNNKSMSVAAHQYDIKRFINLFDQNISAGDQLILDYTPEGGTKVVLNGAVKGTIEGKPFNDLILNTWMGPQPPSKKFQTALLSYPK